ncbi:MAG: hypothetical protein ABWY58_02235 [Aeromicrobium sp.]
MPSPAPSRATSVASLGGYCEIQGLRQMIAAGQVRRSQLPDFADRTEVGGTPLILDFTKRDPGSTAAFVGRLFSAPGLRDVDVESEDVEACTDTTTDADVARQHGGPGYMVDAEARGDLPRCGGFGCYQLPEVAAPYCEVQGIRDLVRSGDLPRRLLPRDADRTVRDGAPLVVDFRKRLNHADRVSSYLTDDLRPAVRAAGATIDEDAFDVCVRTVTQSTIEETQGGPRRN